MSQTFWQQQRRNPYPVRGAFSMPGAHNAISTARRRIGGYGTANGTPDKTLAAIVIPIALLAVLYFAVTAKPVKVTKRNRRRGTKKGQRRKTARRAYAKKRNGTRKGQKRKTKSSRRAYTGLAKRRRKTTRRRRR
jgi:hypothetical protein